MHIHFYIVPAWTKSYRMKLIKPAVMTTCSCLCFDLRARLLDSDWMPNSSLNADARRLSKQPAEALCF